MNAMLRKGLRKYHGLLEQVERKLLSDKGDTAEVELKKWLREDPCWVKKTVMKVKAVAKAIMTDLAAIPESIMRATTTGLSIPATGTAKTADCFTNRNVFAYRDPDLDGWLTQNVPEVGSGRGINLVLVQSGLTFRQMSKVVLGTTADDLNVLGRTLIKTGKTFSLKQVEEAIVRYENGEKALGLNDDGTANFFFVHDEKEESVFVLSAFRGSGGWCVDADELGNVYRWNADGRLLLRN